MWDDRVPARYRDAGPHVVEEDGREYWVYEDRRAETMGLNAVAGKSRDEYNLDPDPLRRHDPRVLRPGRAGAGHARRRHLRQRAASRPCPRFAGTLFPTFKDKDLADLCVQAYNDFAHRRVVCGRSARACSCPR